MISEEEAIEAAKAVHRYLNNKKYVALLEEGKYEVRFIEFSITANAPVWCVIFEHKKVKPVGAWINAFTGESIYALDTLRY